jgi:hypothetical protein
LELAFKRPFSRPEDKIQKAGKNLWYLFVSSECSLFLFLVENGAIKDMAGPLVQLGQMVGIFGEFFDIDFYQSATRFDYYVDRVRFLDERRIKLMGAHTLVPPP